MDRHDKVTLWINVAGTVCSLIGVVASTVAMLLLWAR